MPRRPRASSVPVLVNGTAAPVPARRWLAGTKRSWATFWASETANIVRPSDLEPLERLWSLYDERRRIAAAIGSSPIVGGSKGQPVAHPLYGRLSAVDSAIAGLEDRFGISPLSRARLGIAIGEYRKSLADLNKELVIEHEREP
jgi:P27 family predicted phage terminase small subunit